MSDFRPYDPNEDSNNKNNSLNSSENSGFRPLNRNRANQNDDSDFSDPFKSFSPEKNNGDQGTGRNDQIFKPFDTDSEDQSENGINDDHPSFFGHNQNDFSESDFDSANFNNQNQSSQSASSQEPDTFDNIDLSRNQNVYPRNDFEDPAKNDSSNSFSDDGGKQSFDPFAQQNTSENVRGEGNDDHQENLPPINNVSENRYSSPNQQNRLNDYRNDGTDQDQIPSQRFNNNGNNGRTRAPRAANDRNKRTSTRNQNSGFFTKFNKNLVVALIIATVIILIAIPTIASLAGNRNGGNNTPRAASSSSSRSTSSSSSSSSSAPSSSSSEVSSSDTDSSSAVESSSQEPASSYSSSQAPAESSQPEESSSSSSTAGGYGSYTVRSGDTAYRIAVNHNMTLSQLYQLNGLPAGSSIQPGQVLRVYGGQ